MPSGGVSSHWGGSIIDVAFPANPILNTRIVVFFIHWLSRSGTPPPLYSETGWTGDFWSKTNLLIKPPKMGKAFKKGLLDFLKKITI